MSVTLRPTVSQYVLMSSPRCGCLARYCFLFKSSGLEFVVLSLWGVLSDERPDLSFVKSQSSRLYYVDFEKSSITDVNAFVLT
jgi:hypothetical protein